MHTRPNDSHPTTNRDRSLAKFLFFYAYTYRKHTTLVRRKIKKKIYYIILECVKLPKILSITRSGFLKNEKCFDGDGQKICISKPTKNIQTKSRWLDFYDSAMDPRAKFRNHPQNTARRHCVASKIGKMNFSFKAVQLVGSKIFDAGHFLKLCPLS